MRAAIRLVSLTLVLAVLGSIDSLLTSLACDNMTRTRHDSNRELIGQGVGNAVAGKKVARQVQILGRHPHLAIVTVPERSRDVVKIGHAADVDPGLRHRDHDVGTAEAQAVDQRYALVGIDNALADQIFTGDAEMH